MRVVKAHTRVPESRSQNPWRGLQASTSFAEFLSLLFGCLSLGVADRGFLQVSLQRRLAAGSVVHVVELQDRDVEHRVGPRRATPGRLFDPVSYTHLRVHETP